MPKALNRLDRALHFLGTRFAGEIRARTDANIGYGAIRLPAFSHDTTGLCLPPPPEWSTACTGAAGMLRREREREH